MNSKIFVALFFFILICCLFYQIRLKQELKQELKYNLEDNLSEYEIGYNIGYNTAITQFIDEPGVRISSNINQKYFSYTNQVISDQAIKGYEDGYHKAVESIHCPR